MTHLHDCVWWHDDKQNDKCTANKIYGFKVLVFTLALNHKTSWTEKEAQVDVFFVCALKK